MNSEEIIKAATELMGRLTRIEEDSHVVNIPVTAPGGEAHTVRFEYTAATGWLPAYIIK